MYYINKSFIILFFISFFCTANSLPDRSILVYDEEHRLNINNKEYFIKSVVPAKINYCIDKKLTDCLETAETYLLAIFNNEGDYPVMFHKMEGEVESIKLAGTDNDILLIKYRAGGNALLLAIFRITKINSSGTVELVKVENSPVYSNLDYVEFLKSERVKTKFSKEGKIFVEEYKLDKNTLIKITEKQDVVN